MMLIKYEKIEYIVIILVIKNQQHISQSLLVIYENTLQVFFHSLEIRIKHHILLSNFIQLFVNNMLIYIGTLLDPLCHN